MSFDLLEKSLFGGEPVQLFVFTIQSLVFRYTSADRDLVIGGETYISAQISRSEIRQTVERAKDQITIEVAYLRDPSVPSYLQPSTQPLGDLWNPYAPSDRVSVVCMATHFGDTDPPRVQWMGMVTQPKFNDVLLTLVCEPGSAIDRARNQGPKWQRACWKTVYSTGPRGCLLDPDAFAVAGTLTDVTGLVVQAAEFAAAPLPLAGGWLEWARVDGLVERRSIVSHDGASVELLYGAVDLAAALYVIARPSCEQTWAACEVRDNTINYGGAIYKPVKNPSEESMSWG